MNISSFYGMPASMILLSEVPVPLVNESLKEISAIRTVFNDFSGELYYLDKFYSSLNLRIVEDISELFYQREDVQGLEDLNIFSTHSNNPTVAELLEIEQQVNGDGYNGYSSSRFKFSKAFSLRSLVNSILNIYGSLDESNRVVISSLEDKDRLVYFALVRLVPLFTGDTTADGLINEYVSDWLRDGVVSYKVSIFETLYDRCKPEDIGLDVSSFDKALRDLTEIIGANLNAKKWVKKAMSIVEDVSELSYKTIFDAPIASMGEQRKGFYTNRALNYLKVGESSFPRECKKLYEYFNGANGGDSSWLHINRLSLEQKFNSSNIDEDLYRSSVKLIPSMNIYKECLLKLNAIYLSYLKGNCSVGMSTTDDILDIDTDIDILNLIAIKAGFGIIYIDGMSAVRRHSSVTADSRGVTSKQASDISNEFRNYLDLIKSMGESYLELGGSVDVE